MSYYCMLWRSSAIAARVYTKQHRRSRQHDRPSIMCDVTRRASQVILLITTTSHQGHHHKAHDARRRNTMKRPQARYMSIVATQVKLETFESFKAALFGMAHLLANLGANEARAAGDKYGRSGRRDHLRFCLLGNHRRRRQAPTGRLLQGRRGLADRNACSRRCGRHNMGSANAIEIFSEILSPITSNSTALLRHFRALALQVRRVDCEVRACSRDRFGTGGTGPAMVKQARWSKNCRLRDRADVWHRECNLSERLPRQCRPETALHA